MSADNGIKPLCFVLMPFGRKPNDIGEIINFDDVYYDVIKPAVLQAGLSPIRADEEQIGGIIHKPMFERLMLCDYAVADLTLANANVYYELGIRHAIRPRSTILTFAEKTRLPFDLGLLRGIPYELSNGKPANPKADIATLKAHLTTAREVKHPDSPVFNLIEGYGQPDIKRLKADVFREQVEISTKLKNELAKARNSKNEPLEQLKAIQSRLEPLHDADSGVLIDLFLSYRAVKGFQEMIDLVDLMSAPLANTVMVQEQLGFALNRTKRQTEAERLLSNLIDSNGPSSETCGILGRVYKDLWEVALNNGQTIKTRGYHKRCVETYVQGFESDWRDAYPGINAVTMMELSEKEDPRQQELLAVVTYSVKQRLKGSKPDYWDYATLLELAVLKKQEDEAIEILPDVLSSVRESFEIETTARNLSLICSYRVKRNEESTWLQNIIDELNQWEKS